MSRAIRTTFMSLALSVVATLGLSACGGGGGGGSNPPAASCTDGTKNGSETATDCGGAACVAQGKTCANGLACLASADCTSGYCDPSFVCTTATCADGVKNGAETAADCGGAACLAQGKTCANGKACGISADCTSGYCDPSFVCTTPSCTDGAKNGSETGPDCGGATCLALAPPKTCANGLSCGGNADCTSNTCDPNSHVCTVACTTDGNTCPTGGGACCSGYCNGSNQCATPCKANGDTCTSGTQCCTGQCPVATPQVCTAPTTCTANGLTCPGGGGACCSGYCNGSNNQCADPPTCSANGTSCGFNSDCCSSYCDATKFCATQPTCKANGFSCSTDANCCGGYCNPVTQLCATPVSTCGASGTGCTLNGQCCSGACSNGFCTTTAFCKAPGGGCTDSSECCSMSCVGGLCSNSLCKATGTSCGSSSECCTGSCSTTCQALPAPSGTSACKTLGDACGAPAECCSTNCQGGKCTPAYLCHAPSDICYRAQDCCSGMCTAPATQTNPPTPGRCEAPSGGCNQDGAPCSGASNCCTRLCKDVGAGVTVCQPASGCRMTGDYCDHTASCCGGSDPSNPGAVASPYGVFCDGTYGPPATAPEWDSNSKNDHTCTNGQSCNPPGNICGGSGAVPASQNCCDGKKAVCKQDSNGIYRCFGGCPNNDCTACPTGYDANTPGCCIPAGTATSPGGVCQFRDQCCNFAPCIPDASGVLRCTQPTCTAEHGACNGADDSSCCAGTVCSDQNNPGTYTCQVLSCKANGASCTYANECCSSNCSDGTCAAPCTGTSGSCTTDSDCCAGLGCKIPLGSTSGTCQSSSTCAQTGTSCGQTSDCCNAATGEQCLNGICATPSTCQAQLDTCTSSTQCCTQSPTLHCIAQDGTLCSGGAGCTCDTCLYSGQTGCATGGGSCCLGLSCSSNTCLSCATVGSSCATGGQSACCSGLTCDADVGGSGAACPSGGAGCTCEVCLPLGQSCTSGGERCCGDATECLDPGSGWCQPGDTTCTCQTRPG